jgi:uncharacterized OsmC-like protein
MSSVDLRAIQTPLKERYRDDPASAEVETSARSVPFDPSDPQHCVVAPTAYPDVQIRSGLHAAAGGTGNVPCSGDILASALVICEESTIRSVAANMGVELESVEVEAKIHWDFRGTMGVDRTIPVGASRIELQSKVKVKEGVDPERARRFLQSAERYCATLQTLRNGVEVETEFQLD